MSNTLHGAERLASYQPSKVREVFARASAPGMISLAGGAPHLAELPWDVLAAEAGRLLTEQGPTALQYSFGVGTPAFREQICAVMAEEKIKAAPDDVIVTTGSQLALEAVCKVMVDPGDVVIAEGPCYSGGLSAILSYQADVRHAETDADGVRPEHVAHLLAQARGEGRRVAFVYCIPTFQNPGNTVLPLARREELVRICAEAGVLLVEDNAYGLLGFDGTTMPSLREMNPEGVAYLGSFSKMVAPGLRLGWVLPPAALRRPLIDTVETMVLNPATFNQMMMTAYLTRYDWRAKLAEMRGHYARRCDVLVDALRAHLPAEVTFQRPTGSFYIWATLPPELDSLALMDAAIDRGVVFVPGTAFYADGSGHHEARFSYCLPTEDELRRGGRIVGELFTEALADARR